MRSSLHLEEAYSMVCCLLVYRLIDIPLLHFPVVLQHPVTRRFLHGMYAAGWPPRRSTATRTAATVPCITAKAA